MEGEAEEPELPSLSTTPVVKRTCFSSLPPPPFLNVLCISSLSSPFYTLGSTDLTSPPRVPYAPALPRSTAQVKEENPVRRLCQDSSPCYLLLSWLLKEPYSTPYKDHQGFRILPFCNINKLLKHKNVSTLVLKWRKYKSNALNKVGQCFHSMAFSASKEWHSSDPTSSDTTNLCSHGQGKHSVIGKT